MIFGNITCKQNVNIRRCPKCDKKYQVKPEWKHGSFKLNKQKWDTGICSVNCYIGMVHFD